MSDGYRQHDLPPAELFRDCWFLTGATASGKTKVGLELAEQLETEILSLDSMAVYRGMNIGTAKPTPEENARVPHRLIDILEPSEEFSVTQYLQAAGREVAALRAVGKTPLFVGGTALYLKSLLRGVFQGPPADWEFRRAVEQEVEQVGLEALHRRLEQVDPLSAAKLHPHDRRRMIRALEVHRLTGQPISHLQLQFEEGLPAEACRVFALRWPRAELHARINRRVDAMFERGLVAEVEALLASHCRLSRTASQAVGYREVIAHLQGEMDLPTTIERVKARTRQFARRQEIWFRGLSEVRIVEVDDSLNPALLAHTIIGYGDY